MSKYWEFGLRNEVRLDLLNGFIGKTAIHPSQVPVILSEMRIKKIDYEDALSIVGWDDLSIGVAKSKSRIRMNEHKVHLTWAKKVLAMARIYGITDDEDTRQLL